MAIEKLKALLTELSLEDSPDKEFTPTTHMIFLGLIYDTIAMTVSVPDDKIERNFVLGQTMAIKKQCNCH